MPKAPRSRGRLYAERIGSGAGRVSLDSGRATDRVSHPIWGIINYVCICRNPFSYTSSSDTRPSYPNLKPCDPCSSSFTVLHTGVCGLHTCRRAHAGRITWHVRSLPKPCACACCGWAHLAAPRPFHPSCAGLWPYPEQSAHSRRQSRRIEVGDYLLDQISSGGPRITCAYCMR